MTKQILANFEDSMRARPTSKRIGHEGKSLQSVFFGLIKRSALPDEMRLWGTMDQRQGQGCSPLLYAHKNKFQDFIMPMYLSLSMCVQWTVFFIPCSFVPGPVHSALCLGDLQLQLLLTEPMEGWSWAVCGGSE